MLFLVLLLLIRIDVCTIPLYFINRFMTRCSRTKSLFQIPFHRHINVCLLLDIGEGFKYFLIRIKINQKQGRTLGYTKFPQNIIFLIRRVRDFQGTVNIFDHHFLVANIGCIKECFSLMEWFFQNDIHLLFEI